jgi:uncharacterized protein YciI
MFIVNLTYIKPLEEIEKHLEGHMSFLNKYYTSNNFICSGRKNPRVGGVILCNAKDMEEVNEIISEDPFNKNSIANYEIIEFQPTKYAESFKEFVEQS